MAFSAEELIHGYIDETLDAEQLEELASWLNHSPENARQFAEAILLHDRLHAEVLALSASRFHENESQLVGRPALNWKGRLAALAAAACVICVSLIGVWQLAGTPLLAANTELQRIIQASTSSEDRTYVVTALENDAPVRSALPGSRREQPSVDGALLSVRGADQYVLIRFFADGTEFITGSSGTSSWSIPPRGRVRVSSDPTRFRGAVPGQQHAIPFVDIRNNLEQLQKSYKLDLSPEVTPEGWRRLNAVRKAIVRGGPKEVTLWYDVHSGTIYKMLLNRLPQARGGPRSVLLTLTEKHDLGPSYFEHKSHHSPNREVIEE